MWDWLWETARQIALAQPAAVAQAQPQCSPGYAYSSWEKTGEDRWYEGEWVMQRVHYQRTRTDNCDGSETIEHKTEGPFRLWQAVPSRRIDDVNAPAGSTEVLEGTPLRSSALPTSPNGDTAPDIGGMPPGKSSPGPSKQNGASAPFLPSLALLLGVAIAWFESGRSSSTKMPGAGKTAGGLLWDFFWNRGLPWLADHREQVDRAGGWLTRTGNSINQGWDWVRSNPVGWFVTEVIRRVSLVAVGLIYFVGTTIQSLFELAWNVVKWAAVTSWRNLQNNVRFIGGDMNTKRQMLADLKDKWIVHFDDRFDGIEFFATAFVQGIVTTWKRWWRGLGRVFTDPGMSSDEIIQFGEDTGNVAADVLVVAELAGVAARVARLSRAARLAEVERLALFNNIARAYGYESLAGLLAQRGFTTQAFWRVLSAADEPAALSELLKHFPKEESMIRWMIDNEFLVRTPEGLYTGLGGTFTPWKWADIADGLAEGPALQAKRAQNIGNQLRGGKGQVDVLNAVEGEPGFKRWAVPFRNPNLRGIDAVAEFEGPVFEVFDVQGPFFQAFEVKAVNGPIGPGQVSRVLQYQNGVPKINVEAIVEDLEGRLLKGQLDRMTYLRIRQSIARIDGSFIYRIELTGGSTPTFNLKQLDGRIINGVKILVR